MPGAIKHPALILAHRAMQLPSPRPELLVKVTGEAGATHFLPIKPFGWLLDVTVYGHCSITGLTRCLEA